MGVLSTIMDSSLRSCRRVSARPSPFRRPCRPSWRTRPPLSLLALTHRVAVRRQISRARALCVTLSVFRYRRKNCSFT